MKILLGVFLFFLAVPAAAAASNPYSQDKCSATREKAHTVQNWDRWLAHLRDDAEPRRTKKRKKRSRRGSSKGRR